MLIQGEQVINSNPVVIKKKILFIIYLRERAHKQGKSGKPKGAEGEGEAGSPLSREPSVGLHPRTLGS